MAASVRWLYLFVLVVIFNQGLIQSKKLDNSNIIDDITDIKDFKKLLRTKTNILVLFVKSAKNAEQLLKVFKSVAETIKGEGTLVYVDCSSEAKKLCRKLKISPESFILKHYKDGEFHKDYDRKETSQSMISFMRNPTGDIPWEEDETAKDVLHIQDSLALERLLNKETKPILAMFYAPWCGFCKKLKPDYAQAATETKRIAILAAMDVNKPENSAIRQHFNITGFPTLLYFENGRPQQVYEGENNKEAIVNFIKNPNQPKPKAQEQEWNEIPSDVVHLTDSTFDSYLLKEQSVLVMFYAPWCGHCKAMKPVYVEASAKMKTEKIPGILAAVDATKETNLANTFGIKGYPSVKYIKNGEFAFDVSYRTLDEIISFMKDPKAPPPPPPPEKPWHEVDSNVSHLNEENFKSFLKKKKHALVMFYAPWCGWCKKIKPLFQESANHFQDDLQVAFAAVDCTVYNSLCGTYDVHGFPTIKYFNYLKNVTDYEGERTEEGFVKFMKNPRMAAAPKPSSPAPEEFWAELKGSDSIVHLSSQNFQEVIEKDSVLVLFYATWCGHCRALKGIYCELADILKNDNVNAVIAAIDASIEKSLATKYEITGYPIIKYFRKGQMVTTYNGQRTLADLQNFMRNPPKQKDEL